MKKISQQSTMKNRHFEKLQDTCELQKNMKEYSFTLDLLIVLY